MALDNKFRVSELVQSGSRAIISEDPISKTHTFIDGSTTIVSKSAIEPYEHIEGDRDGELVEYIEKPKYQEEQLKKAVDTIVDELILPPLPPSPEVVPKPVYDDLLEKYNNAVQALAEARDLIRSLQAEIASLQGLIQSLRQQLDAAQVAEAIAQNQLQQQASAFAELSKKFGTAITKAAREASARVSLQAQVEGLTAQKETLREQILQLRQIVASLQGQVKSQIEILNAQIASAEQATDAANQQREDLLAQQEREREAAEEAADAAAEAAADAADALAENERKEALQKLRAEELSNDLALDGKTFTVRPIKTDEPGNTELYYRASRDNGFRGWVNGPTLKILNYSDKSISISFTKSEERMINVPRGVTIESGKSKTVDVIARESSKNGGGYGNYKPNSYPYYGGYKYHGSTMTVREGTNSVDLRVKLGKNKS